MLRGGEDYSGEDTINVLKSKQNPKRTVKKTLKRKMDDEVERRLIEHILQLDDEELQIEEVEGLNESSDDDRDAS